MDERYERLVEARNHPDGQLAKLREDVDAARREFHASKEARDTLQSPCPGLLAGMHVFAKAGRDAKDPVSRMMADMTALMLRMMIQEALAGCEKTFKRAVDGRTRKGRKIGVFVVRSFMRRIRKTRGTDGARRGHEARLETSKSPEEAQTKPLLRSAKGRAPIATAY